MVVLTLQFAKYTMLCKRLERRGKTTIREEMRVKGR